MASIADTTEQCDCAALQCKYNKFTEATVLLHIALLFDLLLPANFFEQMPTLTDILSNIDYEDCYKEQCEKGYLKSNGSWSFEQKYADLMNETDEDATDTVKETTEGDKLLSHICKVLNGKVWPNDVNNVKEVMIKKQLSSV